MVRLWKGGKAVRGPSGSRCFFSSCRFDGEGISSPSRKDGENFGSKTVEAACKQVIFFVKGARDKRYCFSNYTFNLSGGFP